MKNIHIKLISIKYKHIFVFLWVNKLSTFSKIFTGLISTRLLRLSDRVNTWWIYPKVGEWTGKENMSEVHHVNVEKL